MAICAALLVKHKLISIFVVFHLKKILEDIGCITFDQLLVMDSVRLYLQGVLTYLVKIAVEYRQQVKLKN